MGAYRGIWRRNWTYPNDSPALDLGVLFLDGLDVVRDLGGYAGGRVLLEEGTEILLLLRRVGREPLDGAGLALEPVRDEDFVFLRVVRGCEDIGALKCLREEPEDVEDFNYALGGFLWAGDVLRIDVVSHGMNVVVGGM